MYWTVYAASNLPTSLRSPGKSKKLLTKGRRKMRSRSYPYPSMDIDEDVDQPFDKALSKLQKKKSSRLKRAIKKPRKIPNNRTAAKQFHMQLKAAINMDIDTSNSLVKKEGINSNMSRFLSSSPMIISERLSDYSLQSIQESQSFADIITTETTNSSGMFGISSHSQQFYHRSTRQQASASMELRDNVYSSITSDETDEVEKKFKYLSVNSGNELMKKFSGEYYQ
ncbi:16602_t:CDS:1 [Funneliformis mosseae]|uniref:16602_t:CDS:1 n=1 Tax=Funneliformis mosseae TaxID=27381 RepID=A0A9N9HAH3_FUNMO|nr:16602_t:CDS:1 [Funneliformis mosseae]